MVRGQKKLLEPPLC